MTTALLLVYGIFMFRCCQWEVEALGLRLVNYYSDNANKLF